MADTENEEEIVEEKPKGGMLKMMAFGGAAVALLLVGIFAGPVIKDMISSPPVAEGDAAEDAATEDAAAAVLNSGPAIYQDLHPPLVINLVDNVGDSHFMQISLDVMARDQDVINALREHAPAIRNALILFLGAAKYDEVITREGKERLLESALAEIQAVMQERIGKPGIEAAYFTSFIIQ